MDSPGSPASDSSSWDEETTLVQLAYPEAAIDDTDSEYPNAPHEEDAEALLVLLGTAFADAGDESSKRIGGTMLPATRAARAVHAGLEERTDRALAQGVTSLRAVLIEAGRRAREERAPLADASVVNARTREVFTELQARYAKRAEFVQRKVDAVETKVTHIRATTAALAPAFDVLAAQVAAIAKKFDAADAQEVEKNHRLLRNMQAQN